MHFLEEQAPKTAAAFQKALPLEGGCLQARFSGDEFFFGAPVAVDDENRIPPYQGAIAFNCDPQWQAVCIYYGSTIESGGEYYNLFAEIRENLKELHNVGLRIWKEGEEKVKFRKK